MKRVNRGYRWCNRAILSGSFRPTKAVILYGRCGCVFLLFYIPLYALVYYVDIFLFFTVFLVKPLEYVMSKGFYKEKYVSVEVDRDLFAEYFPVQDDVYQNQTHMDLWAYYLEYTKHERKRNRSLGRYGIFIVGKKLRNVG